MDPDRSTRKLAVEGFWTPEAQKYVVSWADHIVGCDSKLVPGSKGCWDLLEEVATEHR